MTVDSYQLSVVFCQLTAVSCNSSMVSLQLTVGRWQLTVASFQLSVVSFQLTVVHRKLTVLSWQLTVDSWQLTVDSFPYLWHMRLCTMERQASAEVGALEPISSGPSTQPGWGGIYISPPHTWNFNMCNFYTFISVKGITWCAPKCFSFFKIEYLFCFPNSWLLKI